MEMKYQKDILKYVSEKEVDARNAIVSKWNKSGIISRSDGSKLLAFDEKARVCNSCGKSIKEANGWKILRALDKHGDEVNCGLAPFCFECEIQELMFEAGRQRLMKKERGETWD